MKRGIIDNWNSGPKRATTEITILRSSKWPETSQRFFIEYIKNTRTENYRREPTCCPQENRAPPRHALMSYGAHIRPLVPSSCYMKPIFPRKKREDFWGEAPPSRGGTWAGALLLSAEWFAGDTSLWEGEIEAIVITNNALIMGGPIFINIFTSTISS